MADFGTLYNYNTASGVVIPQTSDILANVQNAFLEIFGSSFSTDESTPNGVLISAIAMMFTEMCAINAQNANGMNVTQSTGTWLDSLGKNFGLPRLSGETDDAYRTRIVQSASRGSGFASSVRNAIAQINGVKSVVVLDNGNADPSALPKDINGNITAYSIAVPAHSIFICVRGSTDYAVANAIISTKSFGCGYTETTEYGTPVVYSFVDDVTSTPYRVVFYRPAQRFVNISVNVSNSSYTGSDIVTDTKTAIVNLLDSNTVNTEVTADQIIAAIAAYGNGIICKSVVIKAGDSATSIDKVSSLVIKPYQYITTGDTDEEKASFLSDNLSVTVV